MIKLLQTLLLGLGIAVSNAASAQCPTGRYLTDLFPTFTKTTVTYSTPHNLQMDIYQPDGDTYAARPLIILAHGGSFVGGSRDEATIVELCERFAKRGYVTASISYRLGTMASLLSADSTVPMGVVVRAISDGKAAIRYFVKDAATSNTYKIDTNNIFVGGNSAGAVLYMHVVYLGSIAECPPVIADVMTANGGFEGNSGNDGYTTRTKAAINMAGALINPSVIGVYDKPSVNFHGTADNTVPYNCGNPLSGLVKLQLCGLGQLEPAYVANSVYHMSKIYTGDGHVPWTGNAVKFNTVDSLTREFLYNLVCTNVASVNTTNTLASIHLYPNPSKGQVNITTSTGIAAITITELTGRLVYEDKTAHGNSYTIPAMHIVKGLYLVRVKFEDENVTPVVTRLIKE
jgi:para-nitrobenzyl esterase